MDFDSCKAKNEAEQYAPFVQASNRVLEIMSELRLHNLEHDKQFANYNLQCVTKSVPNILFCCNASAAVKAQTYGKLHTNFVPNVVITLLAVAQYVYDIKRD
jgi:hypothetical protein